MDRDSYLRQVLVLDADREAMRILELRRKRRRQEVQTADPALRAEAEAELARLREGFWDLDPQELTRRLADLSLEGLPDLQRSRRRLHRIAEQAGEFRRAMQDERVDSQFLEAVQLMLVARGIDRSERQRNTLHALKTSALRKRAGRSVKVLGNDYPGILALEPQWFEEVRGAQRWIQDRTAATRAAGCLGCLGLWFVLGWVGRIVRWMLENLG